MFLIDVLLKILFGDVDFEFIFKKLSKMNKKDVFVNGYILIGVLVSIFIIIFVLGIGNMNEFFNWLLNLNLVVMLMCYLWVFLVYMLFNKYLKEFKSDYKFLKNLVVGCLVGVWCFLFIVFVCIFGMVLKIFYVSNFSSWFF